MVPDDVPSRLKPGEAVFPGHQVRVANHLHRVWFHRGSDENAGIHSPSRLWWREVPTRAAVVGPDPFAVESAMASRLAIADS